MYCQKCGAQLSETARFCESCGTKVEQSSKKTSEDKKLFFLVMIALVLVILIGAITIITSSANQAADVGVTSMSNADRQQEDLKEDELHSKKSIEITDGTSLCLEGDFPELQTVISNGDVYFEGDFPVLKEVKLTGDEGETLEFQYHKDTVFPSLQTLFCGKLVPDEELQQELFEVEFYFPTLKTVSMELNNSDADFFFLSCLYEFQKLDEQGKLNKFSYVIHHDASDLLGTWMDENNVLSFSFWEDGTVRIADSTGLFGAEVMKYTWVDDNTLTLKAKGTGILNFLSIELEYEMIGNLMWVDVFGKSFRMERK